MNDERHETNFQNEYLQSGSINFSIPEDLIGDSTFKEALELLTKEYQCHTIILYGSRGIGQKAHANSDYDLIGFSESSKQLQLAYEVDGFFVDAWVYPESSVINPDDSFLRIKNGCVICQKGGVGERLLKEVDKMHENGPRLLPESKKRSNKVWLKKMYSRTLLGDLEGNYRSHWLLFECLEFYFTLRDKWYLGPKESFMWLEKNDPQAYRVFLNAMGSTPEKNAIAHLVDVVIGESRN